VCHAEHFSIALIVRLLLFTYLQLVVGSAESDRATLASVLGLCEPLTAVDAVASLKDWLSDTWVNLAMVDYPYAASFLEPLPGWPIKVLCTIVRFCYLIVNISTLIHTYTPSVL